MQRPLICPFCNLDGGLMYEGAGSEARGVLTRADNEDGAQDLASRVHHGGALTPECS